MPILVAFACKLSWLPVIFLIIYPYFVLKNCSFNFPISNAYIYEISLHIPQHFLYPFALFDTQAVTLLRALLLEPG